jgi:asparagine synthase (glutamine-hydrolysing)
VCGIAGFVDPSLRRTQDELVALATDMATTLRHRGPDDAGVWADPATGVAFGHRRLSIIDLSESGHQPMVSRSGRWVLTYNGEIYNFADLRAELSDQGVRFRGSSDTEVLLEYLDHHGPDETLRRADGMFALAAWNTRERVLLLARDRLGEKPLYYGRAGSSIVFGSELKALRVHPELRTTVDTSALTALLRLSYVPAPLSIYEDVAKLPPGHLLEIHPLDPTFPDPRPYWEMPVVDLPDDRSEAELLDGLDDVLRRAVASRMVADVPVGAFLSGGIDSSLVVALMQQAGGPRVRTFSIGFEEDGYDEAQHAAAVARHLGTDHEELYVSSARALDVVPRLPEMYDEPFADSSQIPTYLVSEMTRRHVTVALSGDAGDELFGGYDRYRVHLALWRVLGTLPPRLREAAGRGVRRVDVGSWDRVGARVNPLLPRRYRQSRLGDRAHKAAGLLTSAGPHETYRMLMSHWQDPTSVVTGATEPDLLLADSRRWPAELSRLGQVMYVDSLTYLPDDILTKVDRASMAVSLETRVPFLAPSVVEYAAGLPDHLRIQRGRGKWLLRTLLDRYVPAELVDRPKMGFGVPIGHWLRGPLRPWAEDLLSPASLRGEGHLDVDVVRQAWQQHLSGSRDLKYPLWNVLMFLEWTRAQTGQPFPEPRPSTTV